MSRTRARPYHHGDLRAALLRAAVEAIAEVGAAGMRVRDVARRAGVSHTAATYHFGDRAGLLTAVAVEGFRLLGDELEAARAGGGFLEAGVAYVQFAVTRPAHFDTMFQPRLLHADDPDLRAARRRTAAILYGSEDAGERRVAAGVAAWSLVHGLATLWLGGNVPPVLGDDPAAVARVVASHLRPPRR